MALSEQERGSLRFFSRAAVRNFLMKALRIPVLFVIAAMPAAVLAQTRLYVVNAGADTISVINEYTGEVTATIEGPGHLQAIAYNAHDGLLYVPTHEAEGKVYLLDPATNAFLPEPINVSAYPSAITIDTQAQRAYVSNQFGAVSVIDTATRSVISEIAAVAAPAGTALSHGKLYIVNNQSSEVSIVDTSSSRTLNTVAIGCFNPLDVKVDAGVHKAFVTKGSCPEIAVLDTKQDAVAATLTFPSPPWRRPQYIAIDAAAHRAYVSLYWGHEEKGLHGGVVVIDTVDNSILGEIELGMQPARMALDVPANRLYVTDRRGDRILVVDTVANSVLGQVHVGSDPRDVAVVPARER